MHVYHLLEAIEAVSDMTCSATVASVPSCVAASNGSKTPDGGKFQTLPRVAAVCTAVPPNMNAAGAATASKVTTPNRHCSTGSSKPLCRTLCRNTMNQTHTEQHTSATSHPGVADLVLL